MTNAEMMKRNGYKISDITINGPYDCVCDCRRWDFSMCDKNNAKIYVGSITVPNSIWNEEINILAEWLFATEKNLVVQPHKEKRQFHTGHQARITTREAVDEDFIDVYVVGSEDAFPSVELDGFQNPSSQITFPIYKIPEIIEALNDTYNSWKEGDDSDV